MNKNKIILFACIPLAFFFSNILSLNMISVVSVLIFIILLTFMMDVHLATTLVRLEMLSLMAMASLVDPNMSGKLNLVVLFTFFCVAVTDAVLGLSILSVMIRKSSVELYNFKF